MLGYKIPACEACIIWRKPIGACKIQCQSPSRRLIELRWSHQDIKLNCFTVHGMTLCTCIRICICTLPCGMWSIHWQWSHKYTNWCKWMRDAKFGRKTQVWDYKWNWGSRSINPKINRDLNCAKMHFFGPNLEIFTLIGGDLSHGRTHMLKMG